MNPAALQNFGWGTVLAIATLLVASCFFSGSETALFSLQKLDRQRLQSRLGGDRVLRLLERRSALITTIIIGNETINVTTSAITAGFVSSVFPDYPWLTVVFLTPTLVLLAEVTPKILAFRFNVLWSLIAVWPMSMVFWVVSPIRIVAAFVVNALARLFGVDAAAEIPGLREVEIRSMLEHGTETGHVAERERDIVEAVFEFGELTVGRLMTPRPDIFAVPFDIGWSDLLARCREAAFSRVPIYKGRPDDIQGILLTKDLLKLHIGQAPKPTDRAGAVVKGLLLKPSFVPVSKPASHMLREFLSTKTHMAFVVDEHGTLVGLITLDDLLSELVGEFLDQEEDEQSIQSGEHGSLRVKAWTDVEDFAEETGIPLPLDEGYNTIGGFVFHQLGRLPARGDVVTWNDHRFVVLAMQGRRIGEIAVTKPSPAATETGT